MPSATDRKLPAMPTYAGDWFKDPCLALCSAATRGIWWDLLLRMWERNQSGQVSGDVVQLSQLGRCTIAEMEAALIELRVTKTAQVTLKNGKHYLTNRRMRRAYRERKMSAERQKRYRERGKTGPPPDNPSNDEVTPYSSSSVSLNSTPTSEINRLLDGSRERKSVVGVVDQGALDRKEYLSWCKQIDAQVSSGNDPERKDLVRRVACLHVAGKLPDGALKDILATMKNPPNPIRNPPKYIKRGLTTHFRERGCGENLADLLASVKLT